MNGKFFMAVAFLISVTGTRAQRVFTLSDCYQYAGKNNPSWQRTRNQVKAGQVDLGLARYRMLPSASFGADHYFAFGKNIDPVTNGFATEKFSGGSVGLGMQVNVISGFNTLYSIKQSKYNLLAGEQALQRVGMETETGILIAFSRLLYSKEQQAMINRNIERTRAELEVTNEKILAGKETRNEYYLVNARLQTELAELIAVQNDSYFAREELKQWMGMHYLEEMDIASLDSSDINEISHVRIEIQDILEKVIAEHPAIREARLKVEAARMGISVAKSYNFPTLSLRGSLSSNYNMGQTNNNGEKIPLYPQLNSNFGQNISVILQVPVFSQGRNAGRIKKEKLDFENANLLAKETEGLVVKNAMQLVNDFQAARQKYIATQAAWQQNDLAYAISAEKYKLGMINSLELLTSKDLLNGSLTRYIQARIDLFLKYKLIRLLIE